MGPALDALDSDTSRAAVERSAKMAGAEVETFGVGLNATSGAVSEETRHFIIARLSARTYELDVAQDCHIGTA
jgi:hypothetical protein